MLALAACRHAPDDEPPRGAAETWVNPLVRQRADPHVFRDADGTYYCTATVPEYDRIEVRRAGSLAELTTAPAATIWRRHATGAMGSHVWAPEIHRIDGRWAVIARNGRVFLTYSASATDSSYCMGMLTAADTSDLLDPRSWTKARRTGSRRPRRGRRSATSPRRPASSAKWRRRNALRLAPRRPPGHRGSPWSSS